MPLGADAGEGRRGMPLPVAWAWLPVSNCHVSSNIHGQKYIYHDKPLPTNSRQHTKTLQEQLVSADKNSYCGHRMPIKDLSFPLVAETHLQQKNEVNWLKWELINPQIPPTLHWNQNSWF